MRNKRLLVIPELIVLGLISGLSLYGPAKEKNMDMKESIASAAERKSVNDAPSPKRFETATFAMG